MARLRRRRGQQRQLPRWMFETRTEAWQEAGLAEEIKHGSVRKSFAQALGFGIFFVAVLIAFDNRQDLLPDANQTLIRVAAAVLLALGGWGLALSIGKGLIPAVLHR